MRRPTAPHRHRRCPDRARPLRIATLAAAILLLPLAASADVVTLTDGTRLEGTVRKIADGYSITSADGQVTKVSAERIASVELSGDDAPQSKLDVRLASLRRSVENIDDLALIITKYQTFIDQNAGTEVAEAAQADLEQWQDFQQRGMVKYGNEWMTPAQRNLRQRDAFLEVSDARMQIKQGEIDKAQKTLARMLRVNPQDVSALYLSGVLELRNGELAKARSLFEKVRDEEPQHAPTLVNLAAINIEQNQHQRALTFLLDAMNAAPGNREILDNVAEALQVLPEKAKASRQAQEVGQLFLSQDALLRQQMAERGLYRWGSTWVDKQQLEQLSAIEQEIKQRVEELSVQHTNLAAQVQSLERNYEANRRYMERIEASRIYRDEEGNIHRAPLPPEYYDAARDQELILADREEILREMARLDEEARREQSRYPTPPYKGHLQHIGEDGVPAYPPPDAADILPTTSPATRPGADDVE